MYAVALVTIVFIRTRVGFRVSEEDEIKGLDAAYWAPGPELGVVLRIAEQANGHVLRE